MRRVTYVLLALNIVMWGGLLWIGVGLIRGVINQHAPGYPNPGQEMLCLGFPAAALIIEVLPTIWLLRIGKEIFAIPLLLLSLGVLPFYLVGYSGGV